MLIVCQLLTHTWLTHILHISLPPVVRPLYVTLARISPGMGSRCLALIDTNRAAWAALAAKGGSGA